MTERLLAAVVLLWTLVLVVLAIWAAVEMQLALAVGLLVAACVPAVFDA